MNVNKTYCGDHFAVCSWPFSIVGLGHQPFRFLPCYWKSIDKFTNSPLLIGSLIDDVNNQLTYFMLYVLYTIFLQ